MAENNSVDAIWADAWANVDNTVTQPTPPEPTTELGRFLEQAKQAVRTWDDKGTANPYTGVEKIEVDEANAKNKLIYSKIDRLQDIVENGLTTPTGSRIFASGKYQTIPSTLQAAIKAGYVDPEKPYDETQQEKAFDYILYKKRPQLGKYLKGSGSIDDAALALAKEWASMPSPITRTVRGKTYKAGKSYYGGHNSTNVGLKEVVDTLRKAKETGDDRLLRNLIAKHESNGNYNAYNSGTRGGRIVQGKHKYNLRKMKVADILAASKL